MSNPVSVKVAAIQLEPIRQDVRATHLKAEGYIQSAVANGAELIVLPELFNTGYIPNSRIWNDCLNANESTLDWLRKTALKYKVHLGAGLIEYNDGHFCNTFVMANDTGQLAGRAEKELAESYIFRRGHGRHIIPTRFGNISVGICADNHFTHILKEIQNEKIVLHVMPHAWPTPYRIGKGVSKNDIEKAKKEMLEFPGKVAKLLGVPVIFVNQVGPMDTMSGILGKIMTPELFKLQGLSCICNKDGEVLGRLESEEAYVMAEIIPELASATDTLPDYGGWIHPGSVAVRKVIMPLDVYFGQLRYERERKKITVESE